MNSVNVALLDECNNFYDKSRDKWMRTFFLPSFFQLDEYIASPLVNDSNRFIAESYKNSFQNNDSVLKIDAKQIQVGKATATFFSLNQNNLQSTL